MTGLKTTSHRFRSAVWRQASAWCALALVMMLIICAASPQAHAWVHGRQFVVESFGPGASPRNAADAPVTTDDEAGCVITQFAQGWITHTLTLLVLLAMVWLVRFCPPLVESQICLAGIDELPRCCGPPAV